MLEAFNYQNAMRNMDIGELRPRQVNDDEDDQVQVLSLKYAR